MKPLDPTTPIRVLLVESSRSQRHFLSALIESVPYLRLVGIAAASSDALEAATRLRPDVIVINIQVHGSDGFMLTQQVMQVCPAPIVLLCESLSESISAAATAVGALTVIQAPSRPSDASHDGNAALFLKTVRIMAGVPVVTRFGARPSALSDPGGQSYELLAIAASTGGPGAVQQLVRQLGPAFPLPIVLVQHIASNFVQSLAEWLSSVTAMPVDVVSKEQRLQPGHLYLAPPNYNLLVERRGWATIQPGDVSSTAYCPSGDRLFYSVAQTYGPRAMGLVLSGMGDDGARGLAAMRLAGSLTLAQDEASCVVYGMPQAAVLANAVKHIGSLDALASIITRYSSHR